MFPFLESIRVQAGEVCHSEDHQERIGSTLRRFGSPITIDLTQIFSVITLPVDHLVYKARLLYNLEGQTHITLEPYQLRPVKSLALVQLPEVDYTVKYADRRWIQALLKQAGTDDILLHDQGFIRDTSYANVVFFTGEEWVTPAVPLLPGTHRSRLIRAGILIEQSIQIHQLADFREMRWINALMSWDEAIRFQQGQLRQLAEEQIAW